MENLSPFWVMRERLKPTCRKGMTARNPFEHQPQRFFKAEILKCLDGVLRTGGGEAACP